MPNKKQRLQNITTALELEKSMPPKHRCPNCDRLHYSFESHELQDGSWACDSDFFYDPNRKYNEQGPDTTA